MRAVQSEETVKCCQFVGGWAESPSVADGEPTETAPFQSTRPLKLRV